MDGDAEGRVTDGDAEGRAMVMLMGGDAEGRVMDGDAEGNLVESIEINGIQGFEYGSALDNSDRRFDHLVTVTRGNQGAALVTVTRGNQGAALVTVTRGHQGAARVHNAMLILPIREEVYVWEFVPCVLFPDLGLQPLVHRAQFIRILDLGVRQG